jgi:hypothetical protein
VPRGQRDESLRPYSTFSRQDPLLFLPSSYSVVLTRLSGPRSRPTTKQITLLKIVAVRTSNNNIKKETKTKSNNFPFPYFLKSRTREGIFVLHV